VYQVKNKLFNIVIDLIDSINYIIKTI